MTAAAPAPTVRGLPYPLGGWRPLPETKRVLSYPMTDAPTDGHAVEIAPGILWLRIPIPDSLQFINVWALDDDGHEVDAGNGGGVAIIDTGLGGDLSAEAWRKAFDGPLRGRRVTRVIATHMHPDHVGMAGMFTHRFDCRLWMTRLEFLTCHSLAAATGGRVPEDVIRFYRAAGWEDAMLEGYRERFGFFGAALDRLPDSYRRIRDGEELRIGRHVWRVVVGSGHSPEHAALHCAELGLFISGDQVLPRISPNVGIFPTEPDADNLREWLDSLARIKRLVPPDVLVLPAHNDPFLGLHERIDTLIEGHIEGLAELRARLDAPCRVVDLFPALFRRAIHGGNRLLATGECLAHLNYLLARGEITRTRDDAGVDWYQLVGTAAPAAA